MAVNDMLTLYNEFIQEEKEQARFVLFAKFNELTDTNLLSHLVWKIMNLLNPKNEKSSLVSFIKIKQNMGALLALASYLLNDNEQDVVGNAINAFTEAKLRSLGHRLWPLFNSKETPQRVLYCLARYVEEAVDVRFANKLCPHLSFELSDAYLARTLNALLKHGIVNQNAIEVSEKLLYSHIFATNMDRKASVAAVVYLCFAGNKDLINKLLEIRNKVNIPELRRLLNWGLYDIQSVGKNDFSPEDAYHFLVKATNFGEANYSGYGCFSKDNFLQGVSIFLDNFAMQNIQKAIKTILSLGDIDAIELLAQHKYLGIENAYKNNVLNLWQEYWPINSISFMKYIKNPSNFDIWKNISLEFVYTSLTVDDYLTKNSEDFSWTGVLKKYLLIDLSIAQSVLCGLLLAIEREQFENDEKLTDALSSLTFYINKFVEQINKQNIINVEQEFLGLLITSSKLSTDFVVDILIKFSNSLKLWNFLATNQIREFTNTKVTEKYINIIIEILESPIQNISNSEEEYLFNINSIFLSLLNFADKNKNLITKEQNEKILYSAFKIQAILDVILANNKANDNDDDDEDVVDWNGHVIYDKPITRWNSILQITLNNILPLKAVEQILLESIRIAPHLEKRWVVKALAKLGTDDAVKAILYQAFQHVDIDFVAHTIKELIPSKHPRAQQALIRCIGRNGISDDLKLLILEEMVIDNPDDILLELKNLEILRLAPHIDDVLRDTISKVSSLVENKPENARLVSDIFPKTKIDIEKVIFKLLPEAERLSVDAHSALRTAEMIFAHSQNWREEAVDLSPIVNMHSKGLELCMRDIFEPYTDVVLRKGILSRKLDLLGYARPIPEKMQIFEDYLANLPIIKTIPYFSKFKLRKMLRGICLYRPGKRFTLDGPKAFALLFLVISRFQCQFGLAHLLDLGFASDNDLFEFIKLVHSLQDSRNRAVHEGLTWEARDDIESMRLQAYKIIEISLKISIWLKNPNSMHTIKID